MSEYSNDLFFNSYSNDDNDSLHLSQSYSYFLNEKISDDNYEYYPLPKDEKMDNHSIEDIENKKNDSHYSNSSQKTESSTEKNQSKNLEEKTESSTEKNHSKIFEITKDKQKRLSRKKRANDCAGKEKKLKKDNSKAGLRNDNIIKKIKTKLLDFSKDLINDSLRESNINSFYKINKAFTQNINVYFINQFLYLKLKDIFSNDISPKGKILGNSYNKKLIDKVYKDNKIKTINILEKTFLECLEHFRGTKYYEELNGLEEKYKELINEFKNKGKGEEYIDQFKYIINNFENDYHKKKGRNTTKN